jgi:hypothetical protein
MDILQLIDRRKQAMKHSDWLLAVGLMIVGLPLTLSLTGCNKLVARVHADESPAKVEKIEGSKFSHVTLTEKAIERLALKTDLVREQQVPRSASPRIVVPYSALIYSPQGETWIYTSPQSRTFVRHKVDVDYIQGDIAVLNSGPAAGTVVVTVAAAELYGTEFKVGH